MDCFDFCCDLLWSSTSIILCLCVENQGVKLAIVVKLAGYTGNCSHGALWNSTARQARDPTVHAAIIAHLNQKYGSGSAAQENAQDKNKQVHFQAAPFLLPLVQHSHGLIFLCRCLQGQATQKDKDVTKTTSDLSEDLFKVHDFDVKIDLQVPTAGEAWFVYLGGV